MVDVRQLRARAAARAAARPPAPFAGGVVDDDLGCVVRHYLPDGTSEDSPPVVFLHGGYGVFGDVDLQDGYCRRLASGLAQPVLAIDYPLAPEHSFDESVDAVVAVVHRLGDSLPVTLCGDSAGGAVALAAARRLGPSVAALVLTNPNLDFSLRSVDPARPGGPDLNLSRFAFASWHRTNSLDTAPRLHLDAHGLPPAVIAVGTDDSLAPEAHALAASYERSGGTHLLVEVPDVGHGFMGDPDTADRVIARVRDFLATGGG